MNPYYTTKTLDHFENPRHEGKLEQYNGSGLAGDPGCGDSLQVWIFIEDDKIKQIGYDCQGCAAALASASMMAEMALGLAVDEAAEKITEEAIEQALGGLPEEKSHCSNLGAKALKEAIISWSYGLPLSKTK